MFRVNDLLDLPIISIADSEALHTVKNVLLNEKEHKILALICKQRVFSKQYIVLPYKKIIAVNSNGIMVKDTRSIFKVRQSDYKSPFITDCENIIGKFIINNNGEILGAVRDIFFNPLNGEIAAFEVSEGYFDELIKGRRCIRYETRYRFSESCVKAVDQNS